MTTSTATAQTIEGTWEEVSQQSEKFSGHRVRITVLPNEEPQDNPNAPLIGIFAQWKKKMQRCRRKK
jgi:hypothetical protein